MIKKIDAYIIKKFLGTFVYAIILIISIAIVFDFTERIDDFIEKNISLEEIIFDYYLNFIPYFINLFTALFTFIAVIFFTSKMAYNTEIIAILSSGVSFRRMLVPYFVAALLIAVFSFFLNAYIIPPANKGRNDFSEKYLQSPYRNYDRNIHRQIQPGLFVYMERFNVSNQVGYKFAMERFAEGELKSKLISDYIKWNEEDSSWTIHNYYIRNFDGLYETLDKGRELDTILNLTPANFNFRNQIVEAMTSPELNRFIENERMLGVESIEPYLIEKYRRWSDPCSTFILTLIGVALSSRKVRGGSGLHIGIGLGLSFSYILFMRVASQFAIKGNLDPMIASWIPNMLYAVIGIVLYRMAPK